MTELKRGTSTEGTPGLGPLDPVCRPDPFPGANRRLVLGTGAPISPVQRLATFSDEQFEIFVQEWAYEALTKKYNEVNRRGGAGDKGRDVVAWLDPPGATPRRWDLYQCKHHKNPLTPSVFWVELGKLCFYTHRGDYTVPQSYVIVTHQGVGPALADLLDQPDALKTELLKNWDTYCKKSITKPHTIELDTSLLAHIGGLDFSSIRWLDPLELIDQHSQTRYHSLIFGTALNPRPKPTPPPAQPTSGETPYIQQFYEAVADHLDRTINGLASFSDQKHIVGNFHYARTCFYSVESLKEFARDNALDEAYFEDLADQFYEGLQITLIAPHADGYQRLQSASNAAQTIQPGANALAAELRPNDKVGMCHHLANDKRIHWVKNADPS